MKKIFKTVEIVVDFNDKKELDEKEFNFSSKGYYVERKYYNEPIKKYTVIFRKELYYK